MIFPSETELRLYYKAYAQANGFGISKLGSKNGSDGKQKWFSLSCAKYGVFSSKGKNILQPRPSVKTNCKARICVVVKNQQGEVETTKVCLEHNHVMSPAKARHLRSYKVFDPTAKRKLDLNDETGITLAKSF